MVVGPKPRNNRGKDTARNLHLQTKADNNRFASLGDLEASTDKGMSTNSKAVDKNHSTPRADHNTINKTIMRKPSGQVKRHRPNELVMAHPNNGTKGAIDTRTQIQHKPVITTNQIVQNRKAGRSTQQRRPVVLSSKPNGMHVGSTRQTKLVEIAVRESPGVMTFTTEEVVVKNMPVGTNTPMVEDCMIEETTDLGATPNTSMVQETQI